jgi:glycosyltransferase involved in cell wall biosynthesis
VHVHYPIAQCFPVVGVSTLPHRWKLVVTVHGSDIRVSPFEVPAIRTWQRRLFDHVDASTAVSQSVLDDASQLYGNFHAKARVVHNGVGPQWFELPLNRNPAKDYALFVGRLHQVKAVDVLLKSWKDIYAAFPDTELWIVGDGPERQNLQGIAGELGISARAKFLGPKTQAELPTLYRDARVVVLPSRREGLPIGLLEAGACGALSISTRIPGIPEIIEHGANGYLIEPDSPKELTAALLQVLRLPPEAAESMRRAARHRIHEHFSEERMVAAYLDVYRSVVQSI